MALFAQTSRGLQAADYLVVLVYIVGMLGVGLYVSRQQHGGEDFFVAGRQMPWFAVGLSLVATLLSTITYLGLPGELIQNGIAQVAGYIVLPLAFAVISLVWLPFFMRLRLTSVYEYLELRYGLAARWVGAALFVIILRLSWMGVIVLTSARAVAQITHDSAREMLDSSLTLDQWTLTVLLAVGIFATIYTMLGGIKAVIWTDVAQFVVLFLGAVLTLVFVARATGTGPAEWWRVATSGAAEGHQLPPLASWDLSERETLLGTCLAGFSWYVCTYVSDQVAMQRYFTTPSVRSAIWANAANFLADFAVTILLALCGMALLTYYQIFPAEIVSGVTDPRAHAAADKIFPHFIAHGLPVGVSGLVVAALLAVAMSSLDSGVNSVSTVLTIDVVRRLRPQLTPAGELKLARWLTLVVGLGCTALAWWAMNLPSEQNIIDITLRTFNCALGPLAAMFVVGMFLPHVGQPAIVVSALCGLAVAIGSAWWAELMSEIGLHVTRSPSPFLITPFSLIATFLLAAVLGGLLPQPDPERVRPLTWRAVVFGSGPELKH